MNRELSSCSLCPRLAEFRRSTLSDQEQRGAEEYWRKPVPGFGDVHGRLLVVGLAPAARGGNRTGRVFTGDKSSDFLVSCLHDVGLSNQPTSIRRSDGLVYDNMYLTAAVRCVPPENKPTSEEILNCSKYLSFEIRHLENLRAILCLGSIAFRSVMSVLGPDKRGAGFKFRHGTHLDTDKIRVFCSYHPSPRNVNTGTLNRAEFLRLLKEIVDYIAL